MDRNTKWITAFLYETAVPWTGYDDFWLYDCICSLETINQKQLFILSCHTCFISSLGGSPVTIELAELKKQDFPAPVGPRNKMQINDSVSK